MKSMWVSLLVVGSLACPFAYADEMPQVASDGAQTAEQEPLYRKERDTHEQHRHHKAKKAVKKDQQMPNKMNNMKKDDMKKGDGAMPQDDTMKPSADN